MQDQSIILSDEIQRGLSALAEKHGHAEAIAEAHDQPYVFVDLGTLDLSGYDYDQREARVILRIHKDFPEGQNYGMVTNPILTVDGQQPDNTTRNHQQAQCLRQIGIKEDYLYWSRDWREFSVSKAEDMAKAIAFVRGTLRNPFRS